jgi:hypothetical protein
MKFIKLLNILFILLIGFDAHARSNPYYKNIKPQIRKSLTVKPQKATAAQQKTSEELLKKNYEILCPTVIEMQKQKKRDPLDIIALQLNNIFKIVLKIAYIIIGALFVIKGIKGYAKDELDEAAWSQVGIYGLIMIIIIVTHIATSIFASVRLGAPRQQLIRRSYYLDTRNPGKLFEKCSLNDKGARLVPKQNVKKHIPKVK